MDVSVGTDAAVLTAAMAVLGGLTYVGRSLLRFRDTVRDNTTATDGLSVKMADLTTRLDHDYEQLAARVSALEARLR